MVRLTFPPPVDFQRLLLDLRQLGHSDRAIATAAGISRGAVNDYARRVAKPSYRSGEALISVWCQRTSRSRDEVPHQVAASLSASKVAREDRGPADVFSSGSTGSAAAALFSVCRAWGRS